MRNLLIGGSVWVKDIREDEQWSNPSWDVSRTPKVQLYLHHTAGSNERALAARRLDQQLALMRAERDAAPFGLPYNFLVFPNGRIWYLNDVDNSFPHTYAHNDDTAICLAGNYELVKPTHNATKQIGRLIDALRAMWGWEEPVLGHRDVYPTACPGKYLYTWMKENYS